MKSIALLVLIFFIIYSIVHYKTIKHKEKYTENKIVYRYVPYGVYDQTQKQNIKDLMFNIFEKSINNELYS